MGKKSKRQLKKEKIKMRKEKRQRRKSEVKSEDEDVEENEEKNENVEENQEEKQTEMRMKILRMKNQKSPCNMKMKLLVKMLLKRLVIGSGTMGRTGRTSRCWCSDPRIGATLKERFLLMKMRLTTSPSGATSATARSMSTLTRNCLRWWSWSRKLGINL